MVVYRGSTALVTGAPKGLGEVFADALAARGMNLVLLARSVEALQALAERLTANYGVQCVALNVDLADPSAVTQIGAELKRRGIQVDLLINNAGLGLTGDFLSHDIWKEQAAMVNVQALVALTHFFGGEMAIRGKGGIINLASNSAFQPLPYMATYAAAKAFVLYFSEALQHKLKDRGVRVMAACPGPTATSFFDGTSTTLSAKNQLGNGRSGNIEGLRSGKSRCLSRTDECASRDLVSSITAPNPHRTPRGEGDRKDGSARLTMGDIVTGIG